MNRVITAFGLIGLSIISTGAIAQEAGTPVAKQVTVPIDRVLGKKIKLTDEERDTLEEQKRHNRAMEKALRRMGRDNAFSLGGGRHSQPKRVKRLPPNSSHY